ncbi:MAG TPA: hypothetical protein VIM11_15030 [Tepidisphaeraceae bacterium]
MLASALIEIRSLAWTARTEQAGDLADAFHNLPTFLPTDFKNWNRDWFREELSKYQLKHGNSPDFVEMLDRLFSTRDS